MQTFNIHTFLTYLKTLNLSFKKCCTKLCRCNSNINFGFCLRVSIFGIIDMLVCKPFKDSIECGEIIYGGLTSFLCRAEFNNIVQFFLMWLRIFARWRFKTFEVFNGCYILVKNFVLNCMQSTILCIYYLMKQILFIYFL